VSQSTLYHSFDRTTLPFRVISTLTVYFDAVLTCVAVSTTGAVLVRVRVGVAPFPMVSCAEGALTLHINVGKTVLAKSHVSKMCH